MALTMAANLGRFCREINEREFPMKYKLFIPLLLLAFFKFDPALGAEPIIAVIRGYYAQTSSFGANFTQTLRHKESGASENRSGRLDFKKPFLIYWEVTNPEKETLVINEKSIWNYIPDEEIAYRYPVSVAQDSANIIQVLTGQVSLDRDFEVKNLGKEKNLVKLQLYPKEPTVQLVEAMLWVNEKNGQIQRAAVTDFYGNTNDITLTDIERNKKLNDSFFDFKPPANIEIEDRTSLNNQKGLFK